MIYSKKGEDQIDGNIFQMDIRRIKKGQRLDALKSRARISSLNRSEKSRRICGFLLGLPELSRAGTIFSYMAMEEEVDLTLANRRIGREGKTVAYPISYPGGHMEAAVPEDETSFVPGVWGIRIPDRDRSRILRPEEIDIVLVPCVAFDRKGGRLGHGGGYYDRYLAGCREDVQTILVAFDAQELAEVAMEETDIRMKWIVTETGVIDASVPACIS